ncbi:MAG: serine/threonine-protein kinase [Acidobacteria bacterium]|nr:serine/threonine-protein kinase [Acidobacteriota bacterium]
MIGSTIAHYRITGKLGEGGMGEVYRATDTKLGRDVAVKVLPPQVANDPERLTRFEREAKVLAALNHPHIAAIYGVEHAALVMELVEGETLAGPLPVEVSLRYARQITEALDYAHERGVVHRDLKPANIKVTPDGNVKILDFGLAKMAEPERREMSGDPALSPTLTVRATQAGVIMGTAAYMAPEQARGQAVDKRADVWAFGVVLFEMLSGVRLFDGESISDTLAEVLKKEIDWGLLPVETPANVRWLLRRCLERDRKKRLRDLGDAWVEMPEAVVSAPVRRMNWGLVAGVGLVAALGAGLAGYWMRPTAPAGQQLRYTITTPKGSLLVMGNYAISPDGKRLVYSAREGGNAPALYLRNLDSLETKRLDGTVAVTAFFWAPDSQSIAFHTAGGQLWRMDVDRGSKQVICDTPQVGSGSWAPTGLIVFSNGVNGAHVVNAEGGTAKRLPLSGREVLLMADGKHILRRESTGGLQWLTLDGGPSVKLMDGVLGMATVPGKLLTLSGQTLSAQPFDETTGKLSGTPWIIASQVASFSVSQTGVLVTREGAASELVQYGWFDRTGKMSSTVDAGSHNEVSPDGRYLAYDLMAPNGDRDVWVVDLKRELRQRLTQAKAGTREWVPSWTPDSKRVVFSANRKGRANDGELYVRSADGTGPEEVLLDSELRKHHSHISMDGSLLAFDGGGNGNDIFLMELNGADRTPKPFLASSYGEGQPQFSPDGKLLAYVASDTGNYEVYVHTVRGKAQRWRVSKSGGVSPRWRNDGKEIVYLAADGHIVSVPVKGTGESLDVGEGTNLFLTRILGLATTTHFAMSPDGQRILLPAATMRADWPLTVTVNWSVGKRE